MSDQVILKGEDRQRQDDSGISLELDYGTQMGLYRKTGEVIKGNAAANQKNRCGDN